VDRALYDFAEAAMGKNTEMSWSLNDAVLRRQIAPVFHRCACGDLTTDQALDIALDFVSVRVATMLNVFNRLFDTLENRIDVQMHGERLPALLELEEFFMGLNSEAQWAIDKTISRQELHPVFVRVSTATLSSADGALVFCDMITSKKEHYIQLIQGMCRKLTEQILKVQRAQETGGSSGGQERVTNGDD
jgi:hypothetical protein